MDNVSQSELRQQKQLKLLNNKNEIQIGNINDLPFTVDDLMQANEHSSFVVKTIDSGLTARIYKIKADGRHWCLKKKREESLVKNVDGQTSFLNEIQRRQDFHRLKIDPEKGYRFNNIIDTIYASNNQGIIVSPWIEGKHYKRHSKVTIQKFFELIFQLETEGLFELDYSPGNLLVDNNEIILFDFGYMYKFDPLSEYNPDGKSNPVFHSVERYESRFYFQYLMDVENEMGIDHALQEFRLEKEIALFLYQKKINWLRRHKADQDVIDFNWNIVKLWEKSLESYDNLEKLYALESFRSYVIDVLDDLHGKSCTQNTLRKVDKILSIIKDKYDFLQQHNMLFWGDENETRSSLINKYYHHREQVIRYQIG